MCLWLKGTVQEGPDCYQLSLARDYENLEAEKHSEWCVAVSFAPNTP